MPVSIIDPITKVTKLHEAERLFINLAGAKEEVHNMKMIVHFNVISLLNGVEIARIWDTIPLELDCKNNPELAEAMRVIQQAIGVGRYQQMTALVSEPIENPVIMP